MNIDKPRRKPGPKKGDPRCVAAGRKGGLKNAEKGPEYFREMGKKGGSATKKAHGPEFFSKIARMSSRAHQTTSSDS